MSITPPIQQQAPDLHIPTLDYGDGDDDEFEAAIIDTIGAAEDAAILEAIGNDGGGDDEKQDEAKSGIGMYIFYIYDLLI